MTKNASTLAAGLFAGASLLLNGCSALQPKTDPTRFYILRTDETSTTNHSPNQAVSTLRIGPGRLAAYLDSARILTETGSPRVQPLGYDQWAEPLKQGVERILVTGLRARSTTADVVAAHDSSASKAESRLVYEVTRLGGAPGADVVLDATWSVEGTRWIIPRRASHIVVPAPGSSEDVAGYVARLSRAVDNWAEEISAALK